MRKDTSLGLAVIDALRSKAVSSVGKEYLELGVDSLLESGALRDIPFVNTVVGVFNIAGSFRDQLLAKKILRFLFRLSEVPQDERIAMTEKLNADDKFAGRAGAVVIEMLDRMESNKKPELAAKIFGAYAKGVISFEELRRLLVALERVPSFDICRLDEFSRSDEGNWMKYDEALLLSFVNSGLAQNNGGLDGGVITPTGLCKKFVEIGLCS
ncbi:hypothetical protein [Paracidovorax citrulli]|uniref:hypothetical protein n=1 Tax=Paracidovorax citrulli TaxID=80869 RepID=UPI0009E1F9DB|nr:hypothetical protein [Paracidovorax citrulli]UEG45756.1 hypothetical protein LKW27_19245 [Paracidovorax citrulli]UMT94985.1 hypothetical protein FRC97_08195 [Paracidovorax citrulli]